MSPAMRIAAFSVVLLASTHARAQDSDKPAEQPSAPTTDDDLSSLERAHAHFLLGLDYFREIALHPRRFEKSPCLFPPLPAFRAGNRADLH